MKEKPAVPPRPSTQENASKIEAKDLVQLAWTALQGDLPKREVFGNEKDFRSFCQYYNVLKSICRRPAHVRKEDEVKEILQESRIPMEISQQILELLRSDQATQVDKYLVRNRPRAISIMDVQWRISVTVSTSFVSRALIPSVHLLLSLSDGRVYSVEMTLQKFHQLRLAVASLLKEMQLLQSMPIMQQ